MGEIEEDGRMKKDGEEMRQIDMKERIENMVKEDEKRGEEKEEEEMEVILKERGIGGKDIEIEKSIQRFRGDRQDREKRERGLEKRIDENMRNKGEKEGQKVGRLLIEEYKERIEKERGNKGKLMMEKGRGGEVDNEVRIRSGKWMVVEDM